MLWSLSSWGTTLQYGTWMAWIAIKHRCLAISISFNPFLSRTLSCVYSIITCKRWIPDTVENSEYWIWIYILQCHVCEGRCSAEMLSYGNRNPHYKLDIFNSLWPNDAIWRQGSRSTLVHVMACCLMAASHYLNQCWLIITKVQWC